MTASTEDELDRVVSYLRDAKSVLFITGAGISADSGLPTYRGIGGLYEDADTPEGISIEEALSGAMMETRPALTWRHIRQIEAACRGASFNRAHEMLAEAEHRYERTWVLTQNVDGFHRKAGSRNVIDIHGDIHSLSCTACDYRTTVDDYGGLSPLPSCPECSAHLCPDVVLFGELLPLRKVELMQAEIEKGFDVVFSIGTTSVFPYIARPVLLAKHNGKPTVEINPGVTLLSSEVDVRLPLGAVEACEALWTRLTQSDS